MNAPDESAGAAQIATLQQENRQLRAQLRALREVLGSMQRLSEAVDHHRAGDDVMELLDKVLEDSMRAIDATRSSLLIVDEDTRDLVFVIARGKAARERLRWRRLPAGKGIAGWVVRTGRATIVNDVASDERFYPAVDLELGSRTRSMLAAPVIGGGRGVLGVIEIINKRDGRLFNTGDQALLSLLCRFAGELLASLIATQLGAQPR